MASFQPHPSSYRDPSGFLFTYNGQLYRQVNQSFATAFEQFHRSGLSAQLIQSGRLIPYETINENLTGSEDWFLTLQPEVIPFVSYPYEWCFDMLKDAALLTLDIAQEALGYNMLLKDATAYNLQWHKGGMRFIDTLSFEPYDEQQPWIAYRQFCEQFLTPLALMHYLKEPLQPLLLAYPDGIPLSLAKKLLPVKSRLNLHAFLHLHLQAMLSAKTAGRQQAARPFSRSKMQQLLKSLKRAVESFSLHQPTGVWSLYYSEATQRKDYMQQKKSIITDWLSQLTAATALDAGANEGEFSLLLSAKNIQTVSADFDHYSINNLYKKSKKDGLVNLLPLLLDLRNPTPAAGVNNQEHASFLQRADFDLVLALAVMHHLAIGKNMNFAQIASFFRSLGNMLIIEFVPKEDEKIRFMLQQKPDVYTWYTKENFLASFAAHFRLLAKKEIGTSGRILFMMQRTSDNL